VQPDGSAGRVDIGPWLGRADEWKAQLANVAGASKPAPAATDASAPACGPDGCAI